MRTHAPERGDIWGMVLIGGGLVAISVFPDLANVPSDIFSLGDMRGGRIIALLIIASAIVFYMLQTNRSVVESLKEQFDRFVRVTLANNFMSQNQTAILPEDILLIIPAYNEAENLAKVFKRIPKQIGGRKVTTVVVNDGSSDDTEAVCQQHSIFCVSHPFNRGGGAALRTGYAVAEKVNSQIVVTMDGDGQHKPEEIEILLQPILADEADFVIGSRMLGSYDDYSKLRIAGVHLFNRLINTLMGTKITDCASGFRAIRFSALGKVNLLQDQYHTSELIIDAAKKGLRIVDREIHIAARLHGYSKKGRNFTYAFGFLRTVLVTWWR